MNPLLLRQGILRRVLGVNQVFLLVLGIAAIALSTWSIASGRALTIGAALVFLTGSCALLHELLIGRRILSRTLGAIANALLAGGTLWEGLRAYRSGEGLWVLVLAAGIGLAFFLFPALVLAFGSRKLSSSG